MKCEEVLSFLEASRLLEYDKNTGLLRWKVGNRRKIRAGDIAGGIKQNKDDMKAYLTVGINKRRYRAHRVAVLLVTGSFPQNEVDHINGDGTDNRWDNLRVVTTSENRKNVRLQSNNKSGVAGVCWRADCQKWRAFIKVDRKQIHIGFYVKFEDAVSARMSAMKRLGFHKNHGTNRPL